MSTHSCAWTSPPPRALHLLPELRSLYFFALCSAIIGASWPRAPSSVATRHLGLPTFRSSRQTYGSVSPVSVPGLSTSLESSRRRHSLPSQLHRAPAPSREEQRASARLCIEHCSIRPHRPRPTPPPPCSALTVLPPVSSTCSTSPHLSYFFFVLSPLLKALSRCTTQEVATDMNAEEEACGEGRSPAWPSSVAVSGGRRRIGRSGAVVSGGWRRRGEIRGGSPGEPFFTWWIAG